MKKEKLNVKHELECLHQQMFALWAEFSETQKKVYLLESKERPPTMPYKLSVLGLICLGVAIGYLI